MPNPITYVSVHGGHSGQFCDHATDSLRDIIEQYIALNFTWVGITEHTPAITEDLLDPGQIKLGLTPESLLETFSAYMQECRQLQEQFAHKLKIFAAMEIETYSGYKTFIPYLRDEFQPDYMVGSVHFVDDISIDYSKKSYQKAAKKLGGLDQLYSRYFDQQFEMITLFRPSVVGHFDLVRIFDKDYRSRLEQPEISARIQRNLELIKDCDLIMDLNLRSLAKGADEPYISRPILERAHAMGISVIPGDDSHGVSSVGNFMERGISLLQEIGFPTRWSQPRLLQY